MKKNIKIIGLTISAIALIMIIPSIVNAATGVTTSVSSCRVYTRTNHYLFDMPRSQNTAKEGYAYGEVDFIHDSEMSDGWKITNQYAVSRSSFDKDKFANLTEQFAKMKKSGTTDGAMLIRDGNDYYFKHGTCDDYCFNDTIYQLFRNLDGSNLANLKSDFKRSLYIPSNTEITVAHSFTLSGTSRQNVVPLNNSNFVKEGPVTLMLYRSWGGLTDSGYLNLNINKFKSLAGMSVGDIEGYGSSTDGNCPDVLGHPEIDNKSCEAYVVVDYVVELEREECSYTITYDGASSDAKNVPATQSKNERECINLSSEIPTRDGYTFQYWIDEDDETYIPGEEYCNDENLNLTAVWKNNKTGSVVSPSDDGKNSDNDVKSPQTGVGIAYGLILTVVLGSTAAIIYVKRRNKFENI